VDEAEVSFPWAKGVLPGGDAEHALTADTATEAMGAKDVNCAGCVQTADIDPNALDAKTTKYDDTKTKLGSATVQGAMEKVAALASGSGSFTEGNGTVVSYVEQWGLPAYGEAMTYLHLFNPEQPKVLLYLYAGDSSGFATSNNLVVAYDFTPNQYSADVSGNVGETALQVGNPSIFNTGSHVLIHQTVGTGGNGAGAGNWEVNQVVSVQGTTLQLVKPLKYKYVTCGSDCGRAQAVVAASYNQLEVVNGGKVRPASELDGNGAAGGIVYVRAQKIVVKNGAKVTADAAGFFGGSYTSSNCEWNCGVPGDSPCNAGLSSASTSANCSGGGGARVHTCAWQGGDYCNHTASGGGGGGNKTAGQGGSTGWNSWTGGGAGGGTTNVGVSSLLFGGGGGGGYCYWCQNDRGGDGGGIIVLGASTIIVETGGSITANGIWGAPTDPNQCGNGNAIPITGSGAGGTILLHADQFKLDGTVEAKGGANHPGKYNTFGGEGGAGEVIKTGTIPGVVNESYAKGVELWIDGANVTAQVGDPNNVGAPSWDAVAGKWGKDGLSAWSTGMLDLTSAVPWTLGEHKIELKETGGAGGDVKMFVYVIYPFTKSTPPANDTCDAPEMLDLSGPVVVSGTTEDVMGKTKATDASQGPFCGGSGGPEVVYGFTLADWRQLTVSVSSAFTPRIYIKKGNCVAGEVVACGTESLVTGSFEPGTYYLFVDSDGNMQKGDFTLSVTPAPPGPPPNDTCAAPDVITLLNGIGQASGMTLFANDNYKAGCGGDKALDTVHQFQVPPGTGSLSIELTSEYSPVLYITRDQCTAVPIACIPDSTYSIGWPTPGTYYVFVDGKTAADKGLYTLKVELK